MEDQIKSLIKLAGKGAFWQFGGGTISAFVRLISSTILARLLDPRDFGILGMGLLVTNLVAYLGNMGINSAIIAKKKISIKDLSTAFVLLLVNRFVLYIIIFLAAPLASSFLGEPEVVSVIRVTALVFFLSAFDSIPIALLSKELRYNYLFFVNSIGTIFECLVAIILSYYTNLAYWSLVYAMVVAYLLRVLMSFYFSRWFPKNLFFCKESYFYFKKFLFAGIANSVTWYFKDNIDYLLVGRKLGSHSLGLYEYAYKIPNMFMCRFIFPFASVLTPTLSKIQSDKDAVAKIFYKISRLMFFISFSAMACLAGLSDLFVPIFWGTKWIPIIDPMKILCLAVSLELFAVLSNPIFLVYKRPHLVFISSLIQVLFTCIFVYIGIHYWGLLGVSIGLVFGFLPAFFFFLMACNFINIPLRKIFFSLAMISFCSILFYLFVHLFIIYGKLFIINRLVLLLGAFLLSFLLFLIISYFFLTNIYRDISYLFRLILVKR